MIADIAERIADPGFTPGARQIAPLLDALEAADRKQAARIERALARAGRAAAQAALARRQSASPRLRARLVCLLGRVAAHRADARIAEALLEALDDGDEQVRRSAVRALARARVPGCAARLAAAWPGASLPLQRALADALGKLGGADALELLRGVQTEDAELRRLVARALLMLERTARRDAAAQISLAATLPFSVRGVLRCRAGLEQLLAEELAAIAAVEEVSAGAVVIRWAGDLSSLLAARIAAEICLEVCVRGSARDGDARIAATLADAETIALLSSWTAGRPRFRLAWAQGGAQRARTWRLAQDVARRTDALVNDPAAALWEVIVDEESIPERLLLRPRFADPRFYYRKRDVPASSHPTVAAALARALGARPDDVVWDPFAGSGLELIERARLGPYRELHGSDSDARALAAARENLRSAGVTPTSLRRADARGHRVRGASAVITNPPMGRRLARSSSAALLGAFLANLGACLAPGGRLVWLSPLPAKTAAQGRALGLRVQRGPAVDLGGFHAELQVMRRP